MRIAKGSSSYSKRETPYLTVDDEVFLNNVLNKELTSIPVGSKIYFCKGTRYDRTRFRNLAADIKANVTIKPKNADYIVFDESIVRAIHKKCTKSYAYTVHPVGSNFSGEKELRNTYKYYNDHLLDLFNNNSDESKVISTRNLNSLLSTETINLEIYENIRSVMTSSFQMGCQLVANYNIKESLFWVCLLKSEFKLKFKSYSNIKIITQVIDTPEVMQFTDYRLNVYNSVDDLINLVDYCKDKGYAYDLSTVQDMVFRSFKTHISNYNQLDKITINTMNIDITI